MVGLDTNVLVRLVLDDDPAQAVAARRWFARATATTGVMVDPIALCEFVWVLRARYRLGKAEALAVIEQLLETSGVTCLHEDQVRAAVDAWRNGPADFADYLMRDRYRAAGAGRMVTFDRVLAAESGVSTPR
jgi:predicted nucleic-acid-binding protein